LALGYPGTLAVPFAKFHQRGGYHTSTPGFGELHGLFQAYDLTLATNPLGSGFRAARVNSRSMEITRKDLTRLATEHVVTRPADIMEQVVGAIADWETHAVRHGISRANIDATAKAHRVER
jgi:hypothetical protein